MDPNFNKSPGLALPAPSDETAAHGFQPVDGAHTPEARVAGAETNLGIGSPPAAAMAVPAIPASSAAAPPVTPATAQNAATAASQTVDDDPDAIDREWINKAKAIVEKTKSDPYVESRELGKVKADYLRTRYNKHIKVAEEQPQ